MTNSVPGRPTIKERKAGSQEKKKAKGKRQRQRQRPTFKYPLLWYSYLDATVAHHLTIASIRALKPGQRLCLTLFDRNVWDVTLPNVKQNHAYSAVSFFSHSHTATYRHCKGLSGSLEISWCDQRHEERQEWNDFEWDLEITPDRWFPLRRGRIQDDPKFDYRIPPMCKKSWKEYSLSTRVGWRGPCVLTEELASMPYIFYVDFRL